jgi:hypothetical protein
MPATRLQWHDPVRRNFPCAVMKPLVKSVALGAAVAVAALLTTPAEAARVAIGVGIGVPFAGYYGPGYWGPYYGSRYVYLPAPVTVVSAAPAQVAPAGPNPIFYPKNSQDAGQTEADRQECNRWAATQPAALLDASVFQRATYACMEGRGYTVK